MELVEARKIAQYVIPRLLYDLPQEIKALLIMPGENEDSLLSRLVEKSASDIQWRAMDLENQKHKQYL